MHPLLSALHVVEAPGFLNNYIRMMIKGNTSHKKKCFISGIARIGRRILLWELVPNDDIELLLVIEMTMMMKMHLVCTFPFSWIASTAITLTKQNHSIIKAFYFN